MKTKKLLAKLSLGLMAAFLGTNALAQNNPCDATHYLVPNSPASNQYQLIAADSSSASSTITYTWTVNGQVVANGAWAYYTFPAQGWYIVCLTVSDPANNCTDIQCDSVNIGAAQACNADFIIYQDSVTPGLYHTNNLSTSNANPSYFWSFGDGTTSTLQSPDHTYSAPGTYSVCLTISDQGNCTDTKCDVVTVGNGCNAAFVLWADSTNTGAWYGYNVSASASGTQLSYLWDFGDGTTSTQQFPSHTYAVQGHYTVCLTISDNNGCSDTYCDSSTVHKMLSTSGMGSINILSTTGIAGKKEIFGSISTYPNPVSDNATVAVTLSANTSVGVNLYDVYGKLIMSHKESLVAGKNTMNFNTKDLSNGVYFISLVNLSTQETSTVKIVK